MVLISKVGWNGSSYLTQLWEVYNEMMLNTELPYGIVRIKVSYQNYVIYYRHRIVLLIPIILLYYSYIIITLRKSFWS